MEHTNRCLGEQTPEGSTGAPWQTIRTGLLRQAEFLTLSVSNIVVQTIRLTPLACQIPLGFPDSYLSLILLLLTGAKPHQRRAKWEASSLIRGNTELLVRTLHKFPEMMFF